MINWKNIFKSWAGIPVLILIVLGVLWILTTFVPGLSQSYEVKKIKNNIQSFYERYLGDEYGGKTPEETYELLIMALKKGDIELASKYFVADKQERWEETLNEYKEKGFLSDFVVELEEIKSDWEKLPSDDMDITYFEYTIFIKEDSKTTFNGQEIDIPAGDYTNESIFEKSEKGIWKIQIL
ncbi:MAG: hypothetical protein COV30_00010 [Candidatus Yanofskybacteria bacterium CG10_big_fil_rev_8_21_14_0_10_37_15]|uniref:DUF4878 domain-containing protein n=1 Tax=Candidatus Yanofskybacteria bacterium CG10_big_fil_rev_8_21_14_0_10_37_15 TaxID=1975097 RepID=A0A2H0R8J5_9BACT|nr:MAG: hypothetical protein COV30_00010 [Candidatus Yanofskybacteria bacterium CG10_big_fil_rev_8_21_14_0_10_37_15]